VFGRKSRRRRTELEFLRARVSALETGLTPARAIDLLEHSLMLGLNRLENNNVARDTVVEHLWQKLADQEQDLTAALHSLATLCEALTERLDAQVRQEHELTESMRRELQRGEPTTDKERVVAGSMFGSAAGTADVIDLEEPRRGEGWHNAS
jgi:hypothetical protein